MSRPARGAWVEIEEVKQLRLELQSRPARGAWVEMRERQQVQLDARRAPQGARGLKLVGLNSMPAETHVAPRKGRVG